MTIHAPATVPHGLHVSTAVLWTVLIGAILIGALIVGYQVSRPAAVTETRGPDVTSSWRTDFRHGEIDEGRSGPHSDVLQFRAGEINPEQ